MLNSSIARLPVVLLDIINHVSGETDCIYQVNDKWNSSGPLLISIHVNSKYEWRRWPLKLISACFLILFCLACNSVPENWHICVNKGHTYLLKMATNKYRCEHAEPIINNPQLVDTISRIWWWGLWKNLPFKTYTHEMCRACIQKHKILTKRRRFFSPKYVTFVRSYSSTCAKM